MKSQRRSIPPASKEVGWDSFLSHLPRKRWDGKKFYPSYPGGIELWLLLAELSKGDLRACCPGRSSRLALQDQGGLLAPPTRAGQHRWAPVQERRRGPGRRGTGSPARVPTPGVRVSLRTRLVFMMLFKGRPRVTTGAALPAPRRKCPGARSGWRRVKLEIHHLKFTWISAPKSPKPPL